MRFSCDSCQARYTIDDDKVRGKILRVRCKQCGSSILLQERQEVQRDDTPTDEESTRVVRLEDLKSDLDAAAAAVAPPRPTTKFLTRGMGALVRSRPAPVPEKAEWFIIVQAEEIGPLTVSDLRTRAANSRLLPRTYVWRDGMPNWERLQAVPELKELLQVMPSVVHRSQPPPTRNGVQPGSARPVVVPAPRPAPAKAEPAAPEAIKSEPSAPGLAASGTIAPDTIASGTIASGTIASGTIASGTIASGTIASGTAARALSASDPATAPAAPAGLEPPASVLAVSVPASTPAARPPDDGVEPRRASEGEAGPSTPAAVEAPAAAGEPLGAEDSQDRIEAEALDAAERQAHEKAEATARARIEAERQAEAERVEAEGRAAAEERERARRQEEALLEAEQTAVAEAGERARAAREAVAAEAASALAAKEESRARHRVKEEAEEELSPLPEDLAGLPLAEEPPLRYGGALSADGAPGVTADPFAFQGRSSATGDSFALAGPAAASGAGAEGAEETLHDPPSLIVDGEPLAPPARLSREVDGAHEPIRPVTFEFNDPEQTIPLSQSVSTDEATQQPERAATLEAARPRPSSGLGRIAASLFVLALAGLVIAYFVITRAHHHIVVPPSRPRPIVEAHPPTAQPAASRGATSAQPGEHAHETQHQGGDRHGSGKAGSGSDSSRASRHQREAAGSRHSTKAPDLTPEQQAALLSIEAEPPHAGPAPTPADVVQADDDSADSSSRGSSDIDPKVLRHRVGEAKAGLDSCLTQSLQRNPNLHLSKLNVTLTVEPSGSVSDVGFDESSISETDLGHCLRRVLKTIRLPAFKGDAEEAQFPLSLGSDG